MAGKTVGRYRRDEQIGFGNFGVVYKGVDTVTNRVVAIKSLDLDAVNDEVESVQHEVALLAQLSSAESSNVTKYYGTVLEGSKLWIIMDLCYGGSVRTLLRPGPIEEKQLSVLFREMCIAVQAIHSQGIIHRDIKAANVLITMNGHVKLCDFGVAAANPNSVQTKRQTIVGTPYWMAPEVIQEGLSYTNKADIWSLGITFYEMATGNPPYSDQEAMRAMMLITSSRPPRLEGPKYSPPLKDLVAVCLDEVPEARPEASELLKHKFIKNYAKTPVTVLRSLVTRYSQWKQKHSNQRDSLLMFNPHKETPAETDGEEDIEWDFNTDDNDDSISIDTQHESNESALADAPDSLRELFGMPPKRYDYDVGSSDSLHSTLRPPDIIEPYTAPASLGASKPRTPVHASSNTPTIVNPPVAFPPISAGSTSSASAGSTPGLHEAPQSAQAPSQSNTESAPPLVRVPTAISVSRTRSTTVASPSVSSTNGPYGGWRSRHGSEAQLDALKHPPFSGASSSVNIRSDQAPQAASTGPHGLTVSTHEANLNFGPAAAHHIAPPHSPNASQSTTLVTPNQSPSPKRLTRNTQPPQPLSAKAPAAKTKPRAALPRLQMPPRNAFTNVPLMSAPAGPTKHQQQFHQLLHQHHPLSQHSHSQHQHQHQRRGLSPWAADFPRLPPIDPQTLLDHASDKQAADLVYELLVTYRSGLRALSEQITNN